MALHGNTVLKKLDLSCNPLASAEGGWELHAALRANQCGLLLTSMRRDMSNESGYDPKCRPAHMDNSIAWMVRKI